MFGWKKSYVIVKEVLKQPEIKKVYRKNMTQDSKEIAKKIIDCKYVDAINYDYEGKILGMYCDDIASYHCDYNFAIDNNIARGTIVLMDEFNITSKDEAYKILQHFCKRIYGIGDDENEKKRT